MDVRDFLPLAGVVIGSWLTQRFVGAQHERERQQRSNELRLATYAEWAAGIEAQFNAYATQQGTARVPDVAVCEKRLLLLEADAEIRALVQTVHDAFPALDTEEHRELEMLAHGSSEWEWPPFRKAMEKLLERVRSDFVAKR